MSEHAGAPGGGDQYCPNCGSQVSAKAAMCPECGVSLEDSSDSGGGSDDETTYVLGGLVCVLVGFWILPIVFGPLGLFLGYKAYSDYDSVGGLVVMLVGALEVIPLLLALVGGILFALFFLISILISVISAGASSASLLLLVL